MAVLIPPRRTGTCPITSSATSIRSAAKARPTLAADRLILVDPEGDIATDGQKVLNHAVALGVTQAVLLGFTGRRTDHLLGNLSLLKTFADRLALRIVDDYCDIRLIDRCIRFRAALGQKISLCPLDGAAEEIETFGLKWPLRSESLIPGVRGGISNEVVDNPVEIRGGARRSAVVRAAGERVRADRVAGLVRPSS